MLRPENVGVQVKEKLFVPPSNNIFTSELQQMYIRLISSLNHL